VPVAAAAAEADRRRVEDPWATSVQAWLTPGREYSTNQILTGALFVETKDFTDQKAKRVARVMRSLGWVQTYRREDTGTVRVWKSGVLLQ
jgi:hypothetical protein